MKRKAVFFAIALVVIAAALLLGCSKKNTQTSEFKPINNANAKVNEAVPQSVYDEYRDFEVVPSGEEQCFLSPCDCVCYVIPNVPNTAKKVGCAINCTKTYGIKGCKFTNYQCFSVK
ncbi:MAG: hypothetical protein N3D84_02000 [Candidatus Woesearchaeota archaeon]|nr:hypothetical protein [Candidatus Woesearchaeota archaeon]